jgi:glycosyltransferase involved in cell wall biosynthesis
MRIAFYAPLKSPTHGTPSGDRRVAGLLMDALALAGHRVELASTFRSYDAEGDALRQAAMREQGGALAQRMVAQWRSGPAAARPDLWFTYHVYYKAPDWLGPEACAGLGVPYVIGEASYAPKRAGGPWALGHEATGEAIRRADLVLCPTRHDIAGLAPLRGERGGLVYLAPFLDPAPFAAAARERTAHRARIAAAEGLDPAVPWIAVAGMMRAGDKYASYCALAGALARLRGDPWRLLVAGDGVARAAVEAECAAAIPGRARFLGELSLEALAQTFAACDLYLWPAVNEAYGMAMLEAQAAGLPVVSCELRGVPDVVENGRTGLLVPPGDEAALAGAIRALLGDPERRAQLGRAAAAFVAGERSLATASRRLGGELARLRAGATIR